VNPRTSRLIMCYRFKVQTNYQKQYKTELCSSIYSCDGIRVKRKFGQHERRFFY